MRSQNHSARRAETPYHSLRLSTLAVALLPLAGCAFQSFDPEPLGDEDYRAARVERAAATLAFTQASDAAPEYERVFELLRQRSPDLRDAIARWRTALALAEVETPRPNPSVALGPQFGFGPDVNTNRVVPFANLSLSLPLSGRLARQDDVNRATADAALVDALAVFRELGIELRTVYARVLASRTRVLLREDLQVSAAASKAAVDEAVQAGVVGSFEVSLFRLEAARESARLIRARREAAEARADLAELVAISSLSFADPTDAELPSAPTEAPDLERLHALVLAENPRLARLRAAHEVAERQLQLEVARQYPDLVLGPSFARETGENRTMFGLSLGLELPLFQRNQQAIAQALAQRDQLRVRYEDEAQRVLTALERALVATELSLAERSLLETEVLPASEQNLAAARAGVDAGTTDGLELLDAQRSWRLVQLELLEARLGELEAWTQLERAVGYPLLSFSPDSTSELASPPDALLPHAATPSTTDQE